MSSGLELFDRVRRHAQAAPDRIAYVELAGGRTITYAELVDQVVSFSHESHGEVVPLRSANRIGFPIEYLTWLTRGRTVFPISIELADIEVASLQRQTSELRADGCMLLASSGTTGVPRIVCRDARSLDAVSRNMVDAIGFTPDDHVLAAVPLTHSYGVEHGLLAPLWAGSTVLLVDGMDWPVITRALRDVTIFPAVPSMIEMLAGSADGSLTMPKLRSVYSAGGPLPRAVSDCFSDRFGHRVGQVYGMTEIGSVTFNDPSREPFDPGSVGRPMNNVSIRVLDDGEIIVSAPSMLSSYVNDGTSVIDGHFRTGDVGHLDEHGRLTITGRVRLLIDTGGLKINPLEVESVIGLHPDVRECVVVPVKQSETVQRICAVIVARNASAPPSTESIRAFAKERLAAYKIPRLVQFRASLPRTATGKLQRHLVEVT
ncbi:MAG: AMP-binding protein [Anaerolineae bacterium]|nr:AMP-binding protein [Phycisphaerae bacterium]